MLYVRALNAIYGIMKAAFLFYQNFVGDLMMIGFELNPYDPCVTNKIINGKKLTLVCHVDIKASHVEAELSHVWPNGLGKHTNFYSKMAPAR